MNIDTKMATCKFEKMIRDFKPETMKMDKEDNVAVFVIDMINDFTYTSLLKNPLAVKKIPAIAKLLKKFQENCKPMYAVNDNHTRGSVELDDFPPHGIATTYGASIVDELKDFKYEKTFTKNSTNGAIIKDVQNWLEEHKEITKIVVCGVLTDICIMQFAMTIKALCNQVDRKLEVIVPEECVESYEAEGHNRDVYHFMSLIFMQQVGCKIVKNVEF